MKAFPPFFCASFSPFLALSTHPSPGNFLPRIPSFWDLKSTLSSREKGNCRGWFWGRFWTGAPHRKKGRSFFFLSGAREKVRIVEWLERFHAGAVCHDGRDDRTSNLEEEPPPTAFARSSVRVLLLREISTSDKVRQFSHVQSSLALPKVPTFGVPDSHDIGCRPLDFSHRIVQVHLCVHHHPTRSLRTSRRPAPSEFLQVK